MAGIMFNEFLVIKKCMIHVNMTADELAMSVVSSSTGMVFTMHDKQVLVFDDESI